MTHYLGLKYGNETIALSTGDNILGEYPIQPARMGPGGSYQDVQERISLTVRGASTTAAQSSWQAIGRWLAYVAERRANGEGEKLYLEFQPSGDPVRWRSEIMEASLPPAREALALWANAEVSGSLDITREPFFWGDRTAVSLKNRHNTNGTTAQLRIDNREDSVNHAHVDIVAAQVTGELPTPAEIKLQNDDGSGRLYERFFIGVNAFSNPLGFVPVLEGETIVNFTPTTQAFASSSGGQYAILNSATAYTKIYPRWTISQSWADAFRGRYVRVLAKVSSRTSKWIVQPAVYETYGLQELYVGSPRLIAGANDIYDLGTVPIPPVSYTSDLGPQQFGLIMYHDGSDGASSNLGVDYIFFMPTDSGRTIRQRGMQIPAGDYMVFDEIEGVWVSLEDGYKHPVYSPQGPGVMLFPGRDQRLYLFHDRSSNADPADAKSIQIWYRPRRLTV